MQLIFVTGKGGVGKSTIAAAIAFKKAAQGFNTLLVELGEQSYFESFFHLPQVAHQPIPLESCLSVTRWQVNQCLREYIMHFVPVEKIYSLFFDNPFMRTLINVAPGLAEITILGKATSGIRHKGPQLEYDYIVMDCHSTGHALALLRAPRALGETFSMGPLGSEARKIDAILRDPKYSSYVIVTLAEELPRIECQELYSQISSELGIKPVVVCNRILKPPIGGTDLAKVSQMEPDQPLVLFAQYLQHTIEKQKYQQAILEEGVGSVQKVPLLFEVEPVHLVKKIGEHIEIP